MGCALFITLSVFAYFIEKLDNVVLQVGILIFLMEKYILTDTVNGVHVSKDLQEVLTKAEDDVKNGRVAAIGKTFTELRNMLQEN